MQPLYLGLDVGGSSSRALLLTAAGQVVGQGAAGAGNPVMIEVAQAAREVGRAVRAALHGHDPHRVRAAVLGIAGTSRFAEPAVAAAFQQEWDAIGLTCPVHPVADVLVAFASGTPLSRNSVRVGPSDPDLDRDSYRVAPEVTSSVTPKVAGAPQTGTVLISGTGAVAASIRDGVMVAVADGLGWLLGDRGSGFWLGREAVSAVARAAYARNMARLGATQPPPQQTGPLESAIMTAILGPNPLQPADVPHGIDELHGVDEPTGVGGAHGVNGPTGVGGAQGADVSYGAERLDSADVDALVIAVHNDRPQALAALAPLVIAAAEQGDVLALDVVRRAARELVATVAEIRADGDVTPIVLAGSVLRQAPLISADVTAQLQTRWPAAQVVVSAPGEHGAAYLAMRLP